MLRKLDIHSLEFGLKAVLFAKERILPDPRITTPERHRRKTSKSQRTESHRHADAQGRDMA
jgi:hypothetical protein